MSCSAGDASGRRRRSPKTIRSSRERSRGCCASRATAVASVADASALFANIERVAPDLILLDGDVVQTRRRICSSELRSDERWRDVRVIVAAPWASIDDGGAALPWGADDYVSKPFRVPELLGRVRTQLRASGQLRAARAALRDTAAELERVRERRDEQSPARRHPARGHRRAVAGGDLSASSRAASRARSSISHCSVVLARAGRRRRRRRRRGRGLERSRTSRSGSTAIRRSRAALESERPVLVEDAQTHPLFADVREMWAREGKTVDIRSVATIPFSHRPLRGRACCSCAPIAASGRSRPDDVEFADVVIAPRWRRSGARRRSRRRAPTTASRGAGDDRSAHAGAQPARAAGSAGRRGRSRAALRVGAVAADARRRPLQADQRHRGPPRRRQRAAPARRAARGAVRKVDIVARYGGEEFVVILPETSREGGDDLRRAARASASRGTVRRRRRTAGAFDGEHRHRHFSVAARRHRPRICSRGPTRRCIARSPAAATRCAPDEPLPDLRNDVSRRRAASARATARASSRDRSRPVRASALGTGPPARPRRRRAERRAVTHCEPRREDARGPLRDREEGRRRRDVVRLSRERHRDARAVRDQGAVGGALAGRERDGAAAPRGEPRHAARASERLPHHPARRDGRRAGVRRDAVRRGRDSRPIARIASAASPLGRRRASACATSRRDSTSRTSSRSCIAISSPRTSWCAAGPTGREYAVVMDFGLAKERTRRRRAAEAHGDRASSSARRSS